MRYQVMTAATVGALVAAVGLPAGLLWWLLAPRAEVLVGPQGEVHVGPVSEVPFAVEGCFALIVAGAGLICGYVVYLWQYRMSGRWGLDLRLAAVLGLGVGSTLGTVLAWGVGGALDSPGYAQTLAAAEPGTLVEARLDLRAYGALLYWPIIALVQYVLFDVVSLLRGDLGHLTAADDGRS